MLGRTHTHTHTHTHIYTHRHTTHARQVLPGRPLPTGRSRQAFRARPFAPGLSRQACPSVSLPVGLSVCPFVCLSAGLPGPPPAEIFYNSKIFYNYRNILEHFYNYRNSGGPVSIIFLKFYNFYNRRPGGGWIQESPPADFFYNSTVFL